MLKCLYTSLGQFLPLVTASDYSASYQKQFLHILEILSMVYASQQTEQSNVNFGKILAMILGS